LVAPSFTLLTKLTVYFVRNVLVVVVAAAAAAELLHKVAFDADRRVSQDWITQGSSQC